MLAIMTIGILLIREAKIIDRANHTIPSAPVGRKKERTWEIRRLISKIANHVCHERELFAKECAHAVEDALQDLFIIRGSNCTLVK